MIFFPLFTWNETVENDTGRLSWQPCRGLTCSKQEGRPEVRGDSGKQRHRTISAGLYKVEQEGRKMYDNVCYSKSSDTVIIMQMVYDYAQRL